MSIYLTAFVNSKPGHADQLQALLLDLVKGSRTEPACLNYELHRSTTDENLFIFYEEWADQAGLDKHGTQEHIRTFVKASLPHLAGPFTIFPTAKIA